MLTSPTKYALQDHGGRSPYVTIETNWNEITTPNKFLKFTIGENEAIIDIKHLRSLIWLMSEPEERGNLASARLTELRSTRRKVVVQTNRNIPKGEYIAFWIDIPVEKDFIKHLK